MKPNNTMDATRLIALGTAGMLALLCFICYSFIRDSTSPQAQIQPPADTPPPALPAERWEPRPSFAEDEDSGDFTGTVEADELSAEVTPTTPAGLQDSEPPDPITIPAVLFDPDPSLELAEEQATAIERLRKSFIAAVGGPARDPRDPDYLRRWRDAQTGLDDQLRTVLGSEIFNQLQEQSIRWSANTAEDSEPVLRK